MISIFEFLKRINGFSLPIGGISWSPKEDENEAIFNLLIALADRRIIRYDHGHINKKASLISLTKIRDELTSTIKRLPKNSEIIRNLLNVRYLVSEFQTFLEYQVELGADGDIILTDKTVAALKEFRDIINSNFFFIKDNDKFVELNYFEILKLN